MAAGDDSRARAGIGQFFRVEHCWRPPGVPWEASYGAARSTAYFVLLVLGAGL